jgi:hypothetical protein
LTHYNNRVFIIYANVGETVAKFQKVQRTVSFSDWKRL